MGMEIGEAGSLPLIHSIVEADASFVVLIPSAL